MSEITQEERLALGRRLNEEILLPMKSTFVGKDEIIDLLGVCLIGGENLFLLGPPGTAKSALIRSFARLLHANYFEYLLTRFTEPNEIFGPVDIAAFREGRYQRRVEGMLPTAEIGVSEKRATISRCKDWHPVADHYVSFTIPGLDGKLARYMGDRCHHLIFCEKYSLSFHSDPGFLESCQSLLMGKENTYLIQHSHAGFMNSYDVAMTWQREHS